MGRRSKARTVHFPFPKFHLPRMLFAPFALFAMLPWLFLALSLILAANIQQDQWSQQPIAREHFAALVRHISARGWWWDYGGGIAIRVPSRLMQIDRQQRPGPATRDLLYVSPTGVEKNEMNPEDIFIFDYAELMDRDRLTNLALPVPISRSRNPDSVPTAALNMLRYANFQRELSMMRHILVKDATLFAANEIVCVIHTHSKYANLLSMMEHPGGHIRIANQEMLHGIEERSTGKMLENDGEVLIPIVRNAKNEGLFIEPMMQMLERYPQSSAVVMDRHGIFVWGQHSWERTKQMLECYEYLLEIEYHRRQMAALGLAHSELKNRTERGELRIELN